MKRTLSILLACVLALGMTTAAFAAVGDPIDGFAGSLTGNAAETVVAGSSFTVNIPVAMFTYNDGTAGQSWTDQTPDITTVSTFAEPVVSDTDFTVAFHATSMNVVVTAKATATAGIHNITVNLQKNGDSTTAATPLSIDVTVSAVPDETLTTYPAQDTGTVPATMVVDDTFELKFLKTAFGKTNIGNGTVPASAYAALVSTSSLTGLSTAITTDATHVIVTFTATAAGTSAGNFSFDGLTGTAISVAGITISPNTNESINSAPALTGSIPTSMLVGETFTLTAAKASFGWTATGNGTKPDSAYSALTTLTGVPAGLSYTVNTTDATNVIVTFTAASPATSVTAGTAVTWSTGQTAVTLPAITIEAVVTVGKPTSMTKGLVTNYYLVNKSAGLSNPDNLTVHAGDKIYLPLSGDMFGGNTKSAMTLANLKSKKLTIRLSSGSNSKLIDSYSLTTATFNLGNGSLKHATVEIEFVDPFRSIKDLDFDVTVYPTFDGSRLNDYAIQLSGTMEVQLTEVDSSDDFVALEGKYVADAEEYIKLIECDLGEGVSVWAKMFSGKQYWGYATLDPTDADEKIFDKYPSVEVVYNVDTIGLNSTSNYVTIDGDNDYYVYDANMKYLGRSGDKLDYSTKYYMSTKQLSIVDDVDEDDDLDEPVPEDMVNPTPNNNDNPGTGR